MAETIQNNLTVQPKEKQKQGTGYTNIQRVLGANVGSQLGSTVRQGIQKQAQGVQQQTEQEKGQFQQDLSKGRLDTQESQQAREAAIERIRTGQGVSDQDVQQFAKFRAGEYGGPRQLASEQELLSKAADVSSMARGLGTAEGRQGLLQQFVGRSPSYTAGKTAIDQLLLGRSAEDIKAARAAAMGLGRETFREVSGAREAGRAAEQSARAFAEETGQILGKETSALDAEIQRQMDEAAAAEERRKSTFTNIQNILSGKAAIDAKSKQGDTTGKQIIGGASRAAINPTERAIAELESSGLLTPEQLNSLRGVTGQIGKVKESFFKEKLDDLIRNREVAEKQYGKGGKASKDLKMFKEIRDNPQKFQQWMSDPDNKYSKLAADLAKPATFSEQELGGILNNLLKQQEAYGIGQKTAFIDPMEAIRYNALAKLSGKTPGYSEQVDPLSLYRSGSVGIEQQRISDISKLANDIALAQKVKADSNVKTDDSKMRLAEMTRLANQLRNYGV